MTTVLGSMVAGLGLVIAGFLAALFARPMYRLTIWCLGWLLFWPTQVALIGMPREFRPYHSNFFWNLVQLVWIAGLVVAGLFFLLVR